MMRSSWVWTGEKADVATSGILWVYVKHTAVVTSGGYQEPEEIQKPSRETGRSAVQTCFPAGR